MVMAHRRDAFRFRHPVDVRFSDIDVGGHAHHSRALVYFEEARAEYWREVAGREAVEDVDYVVAEVRVRYHRRILYPTRLDVGVRISLLGKKHFVMEYDVRDEEGERLASGESKQVMYDYEAGESMRIPAGLRERIEGFEEPGAG